MLYLKDTHPAAAAIIKAIIGGLLVMTMLKSSHYPIFFP